LEVVVVVLVLYIGGGFERHDLGLILATAAADLGWFFFLVAVSLGGVAGLCSFKLQNGEFWNQQNQTKTSSTVPVRGLYGQTVSFRFLVIFYRFPFFFFFFAKNQTELDTDFRFNGRTGRSGPVFKTMGKDIQV
jgi:hypothetical protein